MVERSLTAALMISAFGLASCTSGERLLLWPPLPDVKTAVLWDGDVLIASEVTGAIRFPLQEQRSAKVIWAALYEQSLDVLGLNEGTLSPAGCHRSCDLLEPALILQNTLPVDDDPEGWTDETPNGLPQELAAGLVGAVTRCTPCSSFDVELLAIPAPAMIQVAMTVSLADGVVIGTRDGALYRIDPSLNAEVLCLPNGIGATDAVLGPDGKLWIATARGLSAVDLDVQDSSLPCQVETSTAPALEAREPLERIAASKPGEPFEIWSLSGYGRLFLLTESGFRLLGRVMPGEGGRSSMLRLGPGRGFAAEGGTELLRVEGGEATVDDLGRLRLDNVDIRTVTSIDGEELSVLLDMGGIATEHQGRFDIVDDDQFIAPAVALQYRGGLIVSIDRGLVIQYFPDFGFCPAFVGFTSEIVYRAARLSDTQFVFGDVVSNEPGTSAVGILTARPRECE